MTIKEALEVAINELEYSMSTTDSVSEFEELLEAKLKLEELLETM
jgi:predicted RNA-binding protein with EMAP domain